MTTFGYLQSVIKQASNGTDLTAEFINSALEWLKKLSEVVPNLPRPSSVLVSDFRHTAYAKHEGDYGDEQYSIQVNWYYAGEPNGPYITVDFEVYPTDNCKIMHDITMRVHKDEHFSIVGTNENGFLAICNNGIDREINPSIIKYFELHKELLDAPLIVYRTRLTGWKGWHVDESLNWVLGNEVNFNIQT